MTEPWADPDFVRDERETETMDAGALRDIGNAISLLDSMVRSGERHSDASLTAVRAARAALAAAREPVAPAEAEAHAAQDAYDASLPDDDGLIKPDDHA
jgi:hypothetical protein